MKHLILAACILLSACGLFEKKDVRRLPLDVCTNLIALELQQYQVQGMVVDPEAQSISIPATEYAKISELLLVLQGRIDLLGDCLKQYKLYYEVD